jgi:putative PIN family toxin of toxin-antitoxin system
MSASPPSKPVRATVDANLFVSGLIGRGLPTQLLRAWQARRFRMVTARPLREEIAGVLARPKFRRHGLTPERSAGILDALAAADQATLLPTLPVTVRDPADAKYLACALGGQADYLVTGDEDLLVLDGLPALGALRIVTVRTFLRLIGIEPLTPPREEPEAR